MEMGGCGDGRGRGVCIVGIGCCRVGGCSIYSFYRCAVCGWEGVGCRVVDMFSIYIIYSGYRNYSICSYNIYNMLGRAMYNWVDIVWGLGGVCQVGWRVGCWCPRGLLRAVGDMRHSSS